MQIVCGRYEFANRAKWGFAPVIAALLVSFFLSCQPAKAGWSPGSCATGDYGADAYSAAVAQYDCIYGPPPDFVFYSFQYFTSFGGQVVTASACFIEDAWPYYIYCGFATNSCPTGQVYVLFGCVTNIFENGCSCGNSGSGKVGDPVDIASGSVFETATDFKTSGQESLTARRYYNSNQDYARAPPVLFLNSSGNAVYSANFSRFGYGWRSEYDSYAVANYGNPNDATAVDLVRPDGDSVHFSWEGSAFLPVYWTSSGWSSAVRKDVNLKLTYDSTHYYLVDDTDSKYTYNNYGLLLSIVRRSGYTLTFTYDSNNYNTQISDSLGRQINFTYLANGLVNTMTDSAANTTTYNYTEQSVSGSTVPSGGQGLWVLSSVTYPDSTSVTYAYADTNPVNKFALTSITDENGNVFASYTYDSTTGEALTSEHAGGTDLTTVSYNDTAWTRTVTNALNKQTIYSLTPFQGTMQITSIAAQASSLSPAATINYTYDSNGYIQEKTSGAGNSTYYTHNSIGQETSRTDGYGTSAARTVTTVWDSTYNVPDSITEPYLTTAFTYSSGLLTNQTQTDTTTTTVPYSTNGETRQWNSTYYSNGLLDTTTGPDGSGRTITYAYNTNGFIGSVTDQAGNVTQVTSWNVWGEPLTLVDPNGVTTNYTYDLRARLKTITTNPGSSEAVTSFTVSVALIFQLPTYWLPRWRGKILEFLNRTNGL